MKRGSRQITFLAAAVCLTFLTLFVLRFEMTGKVVEDNGWCNGADINQDKKVNEIDQEYISSYWGSISRCSIRSSPEDFYCKNSDINKDGMIDINDLILLGNEWERTDCSGGEQLCTDISGAFCSQAQYSSPIGTTYPEAKESCGAKWCVKCSEGYTERSGFCMQNKPCTNISGAFCSQAQYSSPIGTTYPEGIDCPLSAPYCVKCSEGYNQSGSSCIAESSINNEEGTTPSGGEGTTHSGTSKQNLKPSDASLKLGYTPLTRLKAGDKITFSIDATTHVFEITSLSTSAIRVRISSTPIEDIISEGQTRKFELTGDHYYDLKVELKDITSSGAKVTLTTIKELITTEQQTSQNTYKKQATVVYQDETGEDLETGLPVWVYIIITAAVIILFIGVLIFISHKRKQRYESQ